MIVSRPSRLTSPIRAHTFVVPTSTPTRTASLSTPSPLDEMPPDEGHVVEDSQAERDQCHQVQVEAQPIADEGEDDRHDRVRDEPADEDAIVVDAIELRADGAEHRIERGEDRHGRVTAELEADVDVEHEPGEHANEETHQGKKHAG